MKPKLLFFLTVFISLFCSLTYGQNVLTSFANRPGVKINGSFLLSDSTILLAGESNDLSWIPSGIQITILDTTGNRVQSTARSRAFIIRLSAEGHSFLNVITFPAGTLESVNRIKANSIPGQPTGNLYISGRRSLPGNSSATVYVAKLNQNFITGIPSRCDWVHKVASDVVSTGGKHGYDGPSYHSRFQPFDVMSNGKIVIGSGEEFEFDWSQIEVIGADGNGGKLENFPSHTVVLDNTGFPNMTKKALELHGPISRLPRKVFVKIDTLGNQDSVPVIGVDHSFIALKAYRMGGLRSTNQADFNYVTTDENGNPGRKGRMPDDYLFNYSCNDDTCPADGPGYTGYGLDVIWNARVGEVAIDKRNNDIYFGYTTPTKGPRPSTGGDGGNFDFQSTIVKMDSTGRLIWFARMQRETPTGSPADQFVDGLALDYTNNKLVVLGRTFDTCANNFWQGNEIRGTFTDGFQNRFSGSINQIEVSWLAKYDLTTGRITNSTYVGEMDNNERRGVMNSAPNLNIWPNLDSADLDLSQTRVDVGGNTLKVDAQGKVYIALQSKGRVITTNNALQVNAPIDKAVPNDSVPAVQTAFVRVYNETLSYLDYSSLISSVWNTATGNDGNNVSLTGILPIGQGFIASGWWNGKRVYLPNLNKPAYGLDSVKYGSNAAIFAKVKFNCNAPAEKPGIISTPPRHCVGTTESYSIATVPRATAYQWFAPDSNWRGTSPAAQVSLTATPGNSGQLRVVSKTQCAISLPATTQLPVLQASPITSSKGVVCGPNQNQDTLTARGGVSGNYRWYTQAKGGTPLNEQTDRLIVNAISQTTTYYVAYINASGCESLRVPVLARFGKPAVPTIVIQGSNLVTNSLPASHTRQWYYNGQLIGDGISIALQGSGLYKVVATNACGSSSDSLQVLGTKATLASKLKVYPNPSITGKVEVEHENGIASVEVYNAQGQLVYKEIKSNVKTLALTIPEGVNWCLLRVRTTNENIESVKVVR